MSPSVLPINARPPSFGTASPGQPIHNAIVWQDRRTAATCERLRSEGYERIVAERTGLLLDPYFSGTKIAWILDNVEGARTRALAGELAFGTTDCFLLWRLTAGKVHATDATNASRTLLFDIHRNEWDETLLSMLDVPASLLPEVKDSADEFGECHKELFGRTIPIRGIAGDQQAAAIGQACFEPGMIKSTYGTGCFVLLNTGEQALVSGASVTHHHCLSSARRNLLCVGRINFCCRGRGSMVERRYQSHRFRREDRGAGE